METQKESSLPEVIVEKGAVKKLGSLLADKKTVILTDGCCAEKYLNGVKSMAYESETVITKSKEVGSAAALTAQLALQADCIVALGAGLICESAKSAAAKSGKPLIAVCTVPTTDAVTTSAVRENGRFYGEICRAARPDFVLYDTDIISSAPQKLLAKGYGTLLSRMSAVGDRLIAAVFEDKAPDETDREFLKTAEDCFTTAQSDKSEVRAEKLCRALVASGLTFKGELLENLGSARQTLSFLQIHGLCKTSDGLEEGMAAYFINRLYPFAYAALRVRSLYSPKFNESGWKNRMERKFRGAAGFVINQGETSGRNTAANAENRLNGIYGRAVKFIEALRTLPDLNPYFEYYSKCGGLTRYEPKDVSRMEMRDALVYGRELSLDYKVTDLLWDLGRLGKAAAEAAGI